MGIETVAAIAAPIVIGAIAKAMADSNQDPVDAANNKKTADMAAAGKQLEAYRPKINQSIERGVRGQSTAYQGGNDMLASMGLPAGVPAGLNSNPMSNIFPQNTINAQPGNNAPGSVAPTMGPSGGSGLSAQPRPDPTALTRPSPDAVMAQTKPANTMQDALKIRAALGDFKPGNVAPTVGPGGPPPPDPFAAAMKGPR